MGGILWRMRWADCPWGVGGTWDAVHPLEDAVAPLADAVAPLALGGGRDGLAGGRLVPAGWQARGAGLSLWAGAWALRLFCGGWWRLRCEDHGRLFGGSGCKALALGSHPFMRLLGAACWGVGGGGGWLFAFGVHFATEAAHVLGDGAFATEEAFGGVHGSAGVGVGFVAGVVFGF